MQLSCLFAAIYYVVEAAAAEVVVVVAILSVFICMDRCWFQDVFSM